MTKQQQRELRSVPYDILHAHVQQKDLIITSTCQAIAPDVLNPDQLTLNALVFEAEHQYRRN